MGLAKTVERIPLKTDTTIDVYHFGSNQKGILIVSGIHGDEVTGVFATKKLIEIIQKNGCPTPITIIPVANPIAFSCRTRVDPRDNLDLNRIFPYDNNNGPTHDIAQTIWSFAKEATTIIDLHSSDHLSAIPYVVCLYRDERVKRLAISLNVETIVEGRKNKGHLFAEATRIGIPSIIVELAGKSAIYNEKQGELMAHKLYEFLINKTPSSANKFYGNIVDIDAPNKGILKLEIKPGQIIKKGDIIGMIDDVEVIAPDSGIVLRSVEPSMILKGERICSIALECIKQ